MFVVGPYTSIVIRSCKHAACCNSMVTAVSGFNNNDNDNNEVLI